MSQIARDGHPDQGAHREHDLATMICCSPCRRTPGGGVQVLADPGSTSPERGRGAYRHGTLSGHPPECGAAQPGAYRPTGASAAQVARTSCADREPSQRTAIFRWWFRRSGRLRDRGSWLTAPTTGPRLHMRLVAPAGGADIR
jgi:hypothetical protein